MKEGVAGLREKDKLPRERREETDSQRNRDGL